MPHQPYRRDVPGGKNAVLFLHGIVGTPDHFLPLLPLLPEDCACVSLLLAGHGGSARDFAKASMAQWEKQVESALADLRVRYENVVIAGHSMGCLLAVRAALANPHGLRALFLLAPPLRIGFQPCAMRASIRVGLDCIPEGDEASHWAREACSIAPDRFLPVYLGWIPKYLALFSLSREVRENISRLTVPVTALFSARDEMVDSVRSRELLRRCPLAEAEMLPESTHFHYTLDDLERLKSRFAEVLHKAGFFGND